MILERHIYNKTIFFLKERKTEGKKREYHREINWRDRGNGRDRERKSLRERERERRRGEKETETEREEVRQSERK